MIFTKQVTTSDAADSVGTDAPGPFGPMGPESGEPVEPPAQTDEIVPPR